ncbi:hypothetical protein SAMN05428967_3360 [Phyllobacterium sp. YR620]|nr:hypothetical protein SAMN05428967_3360 [Phyllobacterium sp. YR620]
MAAASRCGRMLFAIVTLVWATAALSEEYPCKPVPPNDTKTRSLPIDPDYLVKFKLVDGPAFAIPYGYYGFALPEKVNCQPLRDVFSFNFWMPDLRAPKKDPYGLAYFRIQEDGHPKPGPDDYIVQALFVERATDADYAKHKLPSSWLFTWLGVYDNRFLLRPEVNGLLRVIDLEAGSNPAVKTEDYVRLADPLEEIRLECSPDTLNPTCIYYIYLSDLQLLIKGRFPYDALNQWRQIMSANRTLIERWIVR